MPGTNTLTGFHIHHATLISYIKQVLSLHNYGGLPKLTLAD